MRITRVNAHFISDVDEHEAPPRNPLPRGYA
jgi:hypothetical protein